MTPDLRVKAEGWLDWENEVKPLLEGRLHPAIVIVSK